MSAFTGGGGGASGTVFGAKGSGSFLFKLTAGLVLAFAVMVVMLVKVTNSDLGGSVLSAPVAEENTIPGQAPTPENTSNKADSDIPGQAQTPADAANKTDSDIPGQVETPAVSNDKPSTTTVETIPKAAAETPALKKETDATPGN